MTPLKKCTKCGEEKPATLDFFSKCSKVKSGLNSKCRPCDRHYKRQCAAKAYQENPEKYRASSREWSKKHRKKCNEIQNRWRAKNPDKAKAQNLRAYKRAISEGRGRTYSREYYERHVKAYQAEYRQKNRDLVNKKAKQWQDKNRDKYREYAKKSTKAGTKALKDWYVKGQLRYGKNGISNPTPEIIELKRIHITLIRSKHERKNK